MCHSHMLLVMYVVHVKQTHNTAPNKNIKMHKVSTHSY